MHCSRRRVLRRGLEFHACTINKSAHTKKICELIWWSLYFVQKSNFLCKICCECHFLGFFFFLVTLILSRNFSSGLLNSSSFVRFVYNFFFHYYQLNESNNFHSFYHSLVFFSLFFCIFFYPLSFLVCFSFFHSFIKSFPFLYVSISFFRSISHIIAVSLFLRQEDFLPLIRNHLQVCRSTTLQV